LSPADFAVAVEHDNGAGRAEPVGLTVTAFDVDFGGGLLEFGGGHLTGNGALPDQIVKRGLILIEHTAHAIRRALGISGADGFVGLLGVFGFGFVVAGEGRVFVAEFSADDVADVGDRLGRDLDAVGSHIRDEADRLATDIDAFIEPLGGAHGLLGGETEFARRIHLQSGCGEGRIRVTLGGLLIDACDAEVAADDGCLDCVG
jgi:hypothetical protein